jgi:hypothetical protein
MRLRRPGKKILLALAVLAALLFVLGLVLDPVATHYTRRFLASQGRYRATFEDVEVTLLPLTYTIEGLTVRKKPVDEDKEPYLRVPRAKVDISWSQLVRGELVLDAHVTKPKVTLVAGSREERETKKQGEEVAERPEEQESKVRLDEVHVDDAEVLYVDPHRPGDPEIWLHHLDVVVSHYSPAGPPDSKTKVRVTGVVQRSGRLDMTLDAYPLAKRPTFSGKARLERLRVAELYALVAPATDLSPQKGTLDMYVLLEAKEGKVRGGIKPVLQNVDVDAAKSGVGPKVKEWLADASLNIFENEKQNDTVATTIPISGDIKNADAELWPTVLGVLRNAFVEGVTRSFANLPLPRAEEKQDPFTQLRDALEPEGGVKQQPD